jgi:hypothetical protein
MELLMLGYTGLTDNVIEEQKSVFESAIVPIEGEVSKEVEMTNTIMKEKKDEEYKQGVENSKNLIKNVDIDDLLKMGGTLVE